MKADIFADIYLWNRDVDRLIRVLQRMESNTFLSKQGRKVYEIRLEEIRAALNAHFAEATATRERADQWKLNRQRTAWEKATADPNSKWIGADVPNTPTSAPSLFVVHFPLKA